MTNYELINSNLPIVAKLINNGLAKIDIFKHLEVYEKFNAMIGNKTERYEKLGKQMGLSPYTVQEYVLKMNKKVK